MKVGYIQFDCKFGRKQDNLDKVACLLENKTADLWVLPELFNTGYTFTSRSELDFLAEKIPTGETSQFLLKIAKKYKTSFIAGIAERENNDFFNSAVCVSYNGFVSKYRKIQNLYYKKRILDADYNELDLIGDYVRFYAEKGKLDSKVQWFQDNKMVDYDDIEKYLQASARRDYECNNRQTAHKTSTGIEEEVLAITLDCNKIKSIEIIK